MNHTSSIYRLRVTALLVSSVVAIGLMVASGFFLKNAVYGSEDGVNASNKACLATLRLNGFSPNTEIKGELQINRATTSDIEQLVYRSGVSIASCPAYTVKDYCAGTGCPNPGVSFTLKQKELQ